jgi:hypothetical protein
MIQRPFWGERIEEAWREAPIVWLTGVRRIGKTTLAQSLGTDRIHYVNCDLPAVADMVADPELFYRNCERPIVVFDEIHQLRDPSRLLKTEDRCRSLPEIEDPRDGLLHACGQREVPRYPHGPEATDPPDPGLVG